MRTVRLVGLALVLSSCGSDGPSAVDMAGDAHDAAHAAASRDAGPAVTFSELYAELFPPRTNARCNFCHSMPASDKSNGNLGMGDSKDAAYAALMNKSSSSSQCDGMPLLMPGEPDKSLFLLKFSEPAPCGARMPLGGAQLSAAQLARVRSWITSGAKND